MLFRSPLTSQIKEDSPFYFKFVEKDKTNYAILSQMRIFDKRRVMNKLGKIEKDEFLKLKERLATLLGFTPTLASGFPVEQGV